MSVSRLKNSNRSLTYPVILCLSLATTSSTPPLSFPYASRYSVQWRSSSSTSSRLSIRPAILRWVRRVGIEIAGLRVSSSGGAGVCGLAVVGAEKISPSLRRLYAPLSGEVAVTSAPEASLSIAVVFFSLSASLAPSRSENSDIDLVSLLRGVSASVLAGMSDGSGEASVSLVRGESMADASLLAIEEGCEAGKGIRLGVGPEFGMVSPVSEGFNFSAGTGFRGAEIRIGLDSGKANIAFLGDRLAE